jgi:hypothetical protein
MNIQSRQNTYVPLSAQIDRVVQKVTDIAEDLNDSGAFDFQYQRSHRCLHNSELE